MTAMTMDHCSIIENESARIAAALAGNRDGRIPWSDRWTVAACAKHVGGTHHVVSQIIKDRPTADFGLFGSMRSIDKTDPGLGAWLTDGTSALVDQLRQVDPAAECWSWHADGRTAGFWSRRMAQETLVHRWDAELGAGCVGAAMDPAVAADGVDEYLDVFVSASRGLRGSPAGPSIHFASTDSGDAWYLQLPAAGERVVGRDPIDTAVSLRGPAESLLLVVWGRLTPDAAGVEVDGDAMVLDRWAELIPPM
jgi:uncharacterized protein (TIGR03083 family)